MQPLRAQHGRATARLAEREKSVSEEIMGAALIAAQRARIAELEAAVARAETAERAWTELGARAQADAAALRAALLRCYDAWTPPVPEWLISAATGQIGQAAMQFVADAVATRDALAAAQADAAALRELVQMYGQHAHTCRWWQHQDCACYLAPAYADHPGAHLLAELTAARSLHDVIVYCGLDYPPIADALAAYEAARKGATDGL
jgi:hypothetical protein